MYDIILKGGVVIDGMGNAPFKADIAVFDDTIALVTPLDISRSRLVIDCSGKYISPGFIDAHTHSDFLVLRDEKAEARIAQGITTDISGNCGIGAFPYRNPILKDMVKDVLGEWNDWSWTDFTSFKSYYEKKKIAINELFLVSHTAIRTAVMGEDSRRVAREDEKRAMCKLLEEELESGAGGFSTGLYYSPCVYSDSDELERLLSVVEKKDKIFTFHHRSEGNGCYDSLKETLEVAAKTGVRTEVSHLKAIGRENQKEVDRMLGLIENARKEGLDVKFDQYPYTFGSTSLYSLLPPRILALSKLEQRMALSLESERERIKREINQDKNWDSIYPLVGPDEIKAIFLSSFAQYNNMSLSMIAKRMGLSDPLDALFDLLRDETGLAVMTDTTETEVSLEKIMVHPLMCFGSDSLYSSPYPHPRSYHAAVEFLSHYTRDKGLLTLEEAVRRMTSETAGRFGLKDRGAIKEGYKADITVFDYNELKSNDDRTNEGIDAVIVNGRLSLFKGEVIPALSGRIL